MKLLIVRQDGFSVSRAVVLTCTTTETIKQSSDLKEALVKACTKWSKTEKGSQAWEDTSNDFNFGDLMCYMDESMMQFISDEGIENFEICDDIEICDILNYDTILISN